jgi:hypothetical protein
MQVDGGFCGYVLIRVHKGGGQLRSEDVFVGELVGPSDLGAVEAAGYYGWARVNAVVAEEVRGLQRGVESVFAARHFDVRRPERARFD